MLFARLPGAQARGRAPLAAARPVRWLAIALVFLSASASALNVTDGNVIDVGYSGVIGADRIVHG